MYKILLPMFMRMDLFMFSQERMMEKSTFFHHALLVQCIFANNSNASGCGLNFTEREDTTVTLYSVQINKIQGLVEAGGYINLPVSGNLTVIAFDILNDEVSDKVAVIYNGLAEIKFVTAMTNQTSTFITTPNSV